MVGNLAVTRDVFEACGSIGKRGREEVVGEHALQRSRHLLAAAIPWHCERNRGVPPPAGLKHRCVQERLDQHLAYGGRVQVAEDVSQRKRMLRPEREQESFFGRGRLKLEVELAAEALAERQPPCSIDPA